MSPTNCSQDDANPMELDESVEPMESVEPIESVEPMEPSVEDEADSMDVSDYELSPEQSSAEMSPEPRFTEYGRKVWRGNTHTTSSEGVENEARTFELSHDGAKRRRLDSGPTEGAGGEVSKGGRGGAA